jgi:hypothetical protein
LENEHACNIGTARETARCWRRWISESEGGVGSGECNGGGEKPFPDGYRILDPARIAHVHAKDCRVDDHKPEWGPLGHDRWIGKGRIAALLDDGYSGWISLETHWPGPGGNKLEGSVICGWNLRGLAAA